MVLLSFSGVFHQSCFEGDHPWLLSRNQSSLNSTMGPCRSRSPTMVPPSLPCLYQTKMVIFFSSPLIGFSSHFALRCFADVWVLGIWRKLGWCCSWMRFSGTISGKFFLLLAFQAKPIWFLLWFCDSLRKLILGMQTFYLFLFFMDLMEKEVIQLIFCWDFTAKKQTHLISLHVFKISWENWI